MFRKIEVTAKQFGLYINEDKTKYFKMRARETIPEGKIKIKSNDNREYNFEKVNQFKYLVGTIINKADKDIKNKKVR